MKTSSTVVSFPTSVSYFLYLKEFFHALIAREWQTHKQKANGIDEVRVKNVMNVAETIAFHNFQQKCR